MKTSLLGLALLVIGCSPSVDADGAGGAGASGSTESGATSSGCPVSQPQAGGACDGPEGLACTYGESARAGCRASFECHHGTWEAPNSACAMSTACDAFTSPPAGETCADDASCAFGDTICGCAADGPFATSLTWQCADPPAASGCPAVIPNRGSVCSAPGLACDYGLPTGYSCSGDGKRATCVDGAWVWKDNGCFL